jgi:hypothetical protein
MEMSPNKERAALLLASGMKQKDVAEDVSVTPATLCNWQKSIEFKIAVNRNTSEILAASRNRLISLSSGAIDCIHELLSSDNDQVRLQVCKMLLSANGMLGDNERSMYRYGWGIGPVSLKEYNQ